MLVKIFKATFNYAPYELEEFADVAAKVTDCEQLSEAAVAYLEAKQRFEQELNNVNVEIG